MNQSESLKNIVFLSQECKNPIIQKLRQQIKGVIHDEKYDWQVARVSNKGEMSLE